MIKKVITLLFLSLTIGSHTIGKTSLDTTLLLPEEDMQWWRDAKFGLFVHYGLYSVLGTGEWAMFKQRIDVDEYAKLKDRFTCEKYDAEQWVEVAKSAGCNYMVVTARHHDGFCLFDTQFGEHDSVNSAAKRDLMAEYADAAHQANMKLGFYYSPLDWRYPGFFFPDMYRANAEEMREQTYTQVRELLSNYGKVDILWYDGGRDNWLGLGGLEFDGKMGGWYTRGFQNPYLGKFSWEPDKLAKMVRELQPKVVMNQRGGWMGDFITEEQSMGERTDRPYEYCTKIGGSAWGWTPDAANNVRTLDDCIRLLVKLVCRDENLLLNVCPRGDGEIEPIQVQRLKEMGEFLSQYGESIYGTRGGILDNKWGGTTFSDAALYAHIIKMPQDGIINLPPVVQKIASATCLNDGSTVNFVQSDQEIRLTHLTNNNNETDFIVKLSYE